MASVPRVLFITQAFQSFVQEDLHHLEAFADVEVFTFDAAGRTPVERARAVAARAREQGRWLRDRLPTADLVFGWFADYHMALPTALGHRHGVPAVVAVAGFDAIALPDLGYGVYESAWRAPIARYVLRNATHVLPCSETMIEHVNTYSASPNRLENGVRAHVPGFTTPYTVVPFGFDPTDWPLGPVDRAPVVCTVGHLGDERVQRRKGIDLLVEAARHLPEATVQVIGVPDDKVGATRVRFAPPPNVEWLPPRPRAELSALYQGASVYAQLSRAEGQPNVLGEAMCSGCVPVGSPVFGIPETIGDTGYVVDRPDPEHVASVLRRALTDATPARREAARDRILTHYSRAQRRDRLRATIEGVLQRSAAASESDRGGRG